MAAIAVTSANTNNINNGNRVVVRTSAGIPYVVLVDATDASIEVWKGDSSTPTSFTEQDTANNPDATTYGSMSAAIDSTGIIHIVFMEYISKSDDLEYVTFNTNTGVFAGAATINTDLGGESSSVGGLYTSIAIDSNNIPHVAYVGVEANAGTVGYVVRYENRIGGAWNGTGVEVEGQTANLDCVFPDIAIDSNNIPVIAYYNDANDDYTAAIGNVNDAASFTLFDVSSMAGSSSGFRYPSIAVDSSGNQHVAYQYEAGVNDWDIRIRKHNVGDAWSTWQAEENVDTSFASTSPGNSGVSLVIKETKRYIFTEDFDVDDIVYYTDASGSWVGPTTIETGTFEKVKARWSKFATFNVAPTVALNTPNDAATGVSTTPDLVFTGTDTDTKIDYVFVDETASPDVQWNTLTVAGDEIEYNVQVDTANTFDSSSPATVTYYFDGSDAAATDPNAVWTNEANIFDNDATPSTQANTITVGSESSNYAMAEGTNAPASGGTIIQVEARVNLKFETAGGGAVTSVTKIYTDALAETLGTITDATSSGTQHWTSYVTLSTPSGGWTWAKIQALETKTYLTVRTGGQNDVYKIEIQVTYGTAPLLSKLSVTPDATFAGTGDPHPWPSGNQVTYTVQAGNILTANTTYYWRVAGTDPSGSNTYGAWATTRSFTTASAVAAIPNKIYSILQSIKRSNSY